jgi:hypothetical protein
MFGQAVAPCLLGVSQCESTGDYARRLGKSAFDAGSRAPVSEHSAQSNVAPQQRGHGVGATWEGRYGFCTWKKPPHDVELVHVGVPL